MVSSSTFTIFLLSLAGIISAATIAIPQSLSRLNVSGPSPGYAELSRLFPSLANHTNDAKPLAWPRIACGPSSGDIDMASCSNAYDSIVPSTSPEIYRDRGTVHLTDVQLPKRYLSGK